MKSLFLGILLIILIGLGGLVYRNAVEHPNKPIACPVDAKVCPDGTSVGRTGLSCEFPVCPPPNVSLEAAGIAFAVPEGFAPAPGGADASSGELAVYASAASASGTPNRISISRYPINASSTALATIQKTAIGDPSGLPVPATAYSSTNINGRQFTVVAIGRFEGTVAVAYYLARETRGDVLRFEAIDQNVSDWMDPSLDTGALPAVTALRALLATLQGG